ncbi:MAG: DUF1569 domain-containing protein [Leptospiraceae bacterium]|nr:DUF1569 domain-containing protein [Leptospiraceae bacterium]MCP5497327.1 DUF1569 domain-containing protein [Leptospiraceae bacterium]
MKRRQIKFTSYTDVINDIENLYAKGYTKLGKWSLGQMCQHLSFYLRGSLDGFGFKLPWIIRKVFGRFLLRKQLANPVMKTSQPTIPASVYQENSEDAKAVSEAKELLSRLSLSNGPLHPSALYDELTVDEWRELHLIHAAHHLSFLIPKD